MSGNIHDTNTIVIRQEITDLMKDIDNLDVNENPKDWESTFRKKYQHLSNNSNTLFLYILSNYKKPSFNLSFFNKTIELMLTNISKIQKSNVTQYDASATIGSHLASTFIPQLKHLK
jgi:hypothetical protein